MKNHDAVILDQEEQNIERDFAKGNYVSTKNKQKRFSLLQKSAVKYKELQKTKPITIRINKLDIIKLKARAEDIQIPYQTLLATLIRQYVDGQTKINI